MIEYICKQCEQPFQSKNKKRTFCSNKCRCIWNNIHNEYKKQKVAEGLRNSEKYKEACRLRESNPALKELRGKIFKNNWLVNKEGIIASQKEFYKTHPEFTKERAMKIATPERNKKISETVFKYYRNKLAQGGLTDRRFERLLEDKGIKYAKHYVLFGENQVIYDYYLKEHFALVFIDQENLYRKEDGFTQEDIDKMKRLEEDRNLAELTGYKFLVITMDEYNQIQSLEDLFRLGKKESRREELIKENVGKNALLYGALPIL